MWENIVDGELARTAELPVASRVAMLGNKVRGLGKVYAAGGGSSGSSSNRYIKFKHQHNLEKTKVLGIPKLIGLSK